MLTADDRSFLESQGWRYEIQPDGEFLNLIVFGYELPDGFSVQSADVLVRLPAGFPDAVPNMFWLDPPALFSNNGQPPGAEAREQYAGRTWQRWSRHLTDAQWRPGIDNLQSYFRFIRTNLEASIPVAA